MSTPHAAALATARRIQHDADAAACTALTAIDAALDLSAPFDAGAVFAAALRAPALACPERSRRVTADALPDGFDAGATLDALDASPVPLSAAGFDDAALVRRFLYLRALAAAATAELDTLKDRVCRLVLAESGERATVAGSDLAITWRHSYAYPAEVTEAEAEVKRLKKYHEHEGTRAASSAVLVVKAPRR